LTGDGGDTAAVAGKGLVHLGKVETVNPSHCNLRGDDPRTVPTKDGWDGDGVTLGDLARRCMAGNSWVRHNATQFSHFRELGETPAG
jgi:hypothetical protein